METPHEAPDQPALREEQTEAEPLSFDRQRRENEKNLTARLDQIRCGQAVDVLAPFAKVYLGQCLDIDSRLEPKARVALLASAVLAEAVFEGFVAVLRLRDIPTPAEIGEAAARGERYPVGYVLLAGMDLVARRSMDEVPAVPQPALRSALCFHFTNTTEHPDAWVDELLRTQSGLVAPALLDLWLPLTANGADHLPGLYRVIGDETSAPVVKQAVLPLLRHWPECNTKVLGDLLHAALLHADRSELLAIAAEHLVCADQLEVRRRIYWLATAYLLSPQQYTHALGAYTGRAREKILRLLDFVVTALSQPAGSTVTLPPMALAHLLRIIAPLFRRNHPLAGGLDAMSQKVLWLFDLLVSDRSDEAVDAVAMLRKVRVMRIYSDVLDDAGHGSE